MALPKAAGWWDTRTQTDKILDEGNDQKKFNIIDKRITQALFKRVLGKEFCEISPADKLSYNKPGWVVKTIADRIDDRNSKENGIKT